MIIKLYTAVVMLSSSKDAAMTTSKAAPTEELEDAFCLGVVHNLYSGRGCNGISSYCNTFPGQLLHKCSFS